MEFQEYNIKPQDLQLHCRTCLNLLTDKYAVSEMAPTLFHVFKQCTGYKKKEKGLYPDCICGQCYEKLEAVDEFQRMSKSSLKFLQDLVKSYKPLSTDQLSPTSTEELYQLDDSEEFLPEPQIVLNEDPLEETASDNEISVKMENDEAATSFSALMEPSSIEIDVTDQKSTTEIEATNETTKTEHTCQVCFKVYSSASSLSMHKRTHLEKRPFQCEKCDRGFNKRFRLNDHIKKFHTENTSEIPCSYGGCDSTFPSKEAAEAHYLEKHPSNMTFKADSWESDDSNANRESNVSNSQENADLKKLVLKVKKEKPPPNKLFMCTICVKTYSSNTALRIHMVTHLEKRPFQCDKCERGFNTNARLKRHIDEIHAENPIEIVCKFGCGKVFHRYSTAQAHYKHKHILPAAGIPPKDYSCICEECGKVCKNKYFLTEHSFQHVAYDDLPYICEPCNRRFRSKKHLKRHLVRHEPIKKFQCPHCTLRTATREELRKHINRHTKEIEYPCPICNKIFTGGENMRRHKRIVHEGVKNYKCRFCEESFGKAETRKHHEMRHTGEKPHKCQMCDRSFIQLVALKAHLKTHNKLPKFPDAQRSDATNIPEANTKLDGITKLPGFAAESQRLTALLDAGGINKLPGFPETQKLPAMDMTEASTLLDVSKNLL